LHKIQAAAESVIKEVSSATKEEQENLPAGVVYETDDQKNLLYPVGTLYHMFQEVDGSFYVCNRYRVKYGELRISIRSLTDHMVGSYQETIKLVKRQFGFEDDLLVGVIAEQVLLTRAITPAPPLPSISDAETSGSNNNSGNDGDIPTVAGAAPPKITTRPPNCPIQ